MTKSSEFIDLQGLEYFLFEEDFIEKNIRCIPMIVRFKMDAAGIKLKLSEWSKFIVEERKELAVKKCNTNEEVAAYNKYLKGLVEKYTGTAAAEMEAEKNPVWADVVNIPAQLQERAKQSGRGINATQWKNLTDLQRFALLKLCRPGHESKNFLKAMNEFNIHT